LWFCVSVPLVFLGSFFGYKREVVTFPTRTNLVPRAIPTQPWYDAGPELSVPFTPSHSPCNHPLLRSPLVRPPSPPPGTCTQ
jgi:hypothetical protein